MFEQKIRPRDIMTSPVYTVQPTDRVKRIIALPGVRFEPEYQGRRRFTVNRKRG